MKKLLFFTALGVAFFILGFIVDVVEKKKEEKENREDERHHFYGPYEKYFKRPLDFSLALLILPFFSPILLSTALLVRVKLGSPIIFSQERPGRNERIFKIYKFRSMSNEVDKNGNLLPDDIRLTQFGHFLRNSSLDELPEIFNILKGDMSIVGPRPQLVRDMVFMTQEQRKRHDVRPGLTGLAQVNGRNGISWDDKLKYDLEYEENISIVKDLKIILKTAKAVFCREGIAMEGMATAEDLGDYLLRTNRIMQIEYNDKQCDAKELLNFEHEKKQRKRM